jgi:tetratricopeptide (TPR) repeat protein
MTKKELSDRIEDYLLNRMSDSEQAQFESELDSNPELKIITEKKAILISGIKTGFDNELKEKLKREDQHIGDTKGKRKLSFIPGIAAALFIAFASFFFINKMRHDPSRLYAEYFHSYPNINQPLTRDTEQNENPFFLYEKGEYREALVRFNDRLKAFPEDDAAIFYSGIINMEMKDFEKAIENFKTVTEIDQSRFTRPARWYMALSYIAIGNTEMASGSLRELTREDDRFGTDAEKILQRLK